MNKKLQQHVSKLNTSTEDVFDHIFEIKSFEAENFIWGKNKKEIEATQNQNLKAYFYERLIWAAEIIFQESFMMGYFIISALLAYFGKIDFSAVVGLIFVTGYAVDLLFQIPYSLSSFYDVSPKIQRYLDFVKEKHSSSKSLHTKFVKEENVKDAVFIHQLNYKYKDKKVISYFIKP